MSKTKLRVFHGTSSDALDSIRAHGLRASTAKDHYADPRWYTVASDFGSASFHAPQQHTKRGRPIVLEFVIPTKPSDPWPGWPYLWPGAQRDGSRSVWYALRQLLPARFLKTVHEKDGRPAVRRNPQKSSLVLPAGSRLFHGTLETIKGRLRPGGDGVLWFADTPAVAQLYIPRSSLSMYSGSDTVARPSKDEQIQIIQKRIGLNYDLSQVRWDALGRASSFLIPDAWRNVDLNREMNVEVERRLAEAGYDGAGADGWKRYEFHFGDGKLLPAGGVQMGQLCVATTTRDLRLWPKALGEGDLTDVQYHDVKGFRDASESGYDGVLIDDFAQSEEWGNLGHLSVGIFANAIRSLEYECVPATYEEYDRKHYTKAWPDRSVKPYFGELLSRGSQPPAKNPAKRDMRPAENSAPERLTIVRERLSRAEAFDLWAPSFMRGHKTTRERANEMFPTDEGPWTLAWVPRACMTYRYLRNRRFRLEGHAYARSAPEDAPPGVAVPKDRGVLYVLDGNTRVDASILRGDATVLMLVPTQAKDLQTLCRRHENPRRRNVSAPASLANTSLYHGTPSEAAAKQILRTRVLVPRSKTRVRSHGRGHTDPVHDGVYLTTDRSEAMRYALSSATKDAYGYLFEVDGAALGDVEPDEDFVGDLAQAALSFCRGEPDSGALKRACSRFSAADFGRRPGTAVARFYELVQKHATRLQKDYLETTASMSVAMRAQIGRKLVSKMDSEMRLWVLSLSSSLANIGPIPVDRAWRIKKSVGRKMDARKAFGAAEVVRDRNPSAILEWPYGVFASTRGRRNRELLVGIFDTTIPRPEDAIVAMMSAARGFDDGREVYFVQAVAATRDLGPVIYQIGMHAARKDGGWLGSEDESRSSAALEVWNAFIRRADIECVALVDTPGVMCRGPAPEGLEGAVERGSEYLGQAAEVRGVQKTDLLRTAADIMWGEMAPRRAWRVRPVTWTDQRNG